MDTQTQNTDAGEGSAEHTPGPWKSGHTSSHERRIAKVLKGTGMKGGHNTYCDILTPRHHITEAEAAENARLIAQAPALKQERDRLRYALQQCLSWLENVPLWDPHESADEIRACVQQGRSALASTESRKAEGEMCMPACNVPREEGEACTWTWTGEPECSYETGCGGLFQITSGTPAENEMDYCPFCGGVIKSREEAAEGNSDE